MYQISMQILNVHLTSAQVAAHTDPARLEYSQLIDSDEIRAVFDQYDVVTFKEDEVIVEVEDLETILELGFALGKVYFVTPPTSITQF